MRRWRRLLPCLLFLAVALAGQAAESGPASARLTFIKTFKGSAPEYTRVTVERSGHAVYQGGLIDQPEEPETFQLSATTTERLFQLAAQLNHFRNIELEAGKQVAYLGEKVFRYEEVGERTEARYNYTENAAAKKLQDLFERIARGRFFIQQLAYRLQFDRLGVPQALREFERAFNAGRLVDLQQFVPVLEQVAEDEKVIRLARTRARDLLRRIRSGRGRLRYEHADPQVGWYTKLTVEEQGRVTYERRRVDQPPEEREIGVSRPVVERLLELVRAANYFRGAESADPSDRLSSGYRLTYQAGALHRQVAFSQPPDAVLAEIVYLFQKIVYQEDLRVRLEAAVQANSFMLQVLLQELDRAIQSNSLADSSVFVPLLEKIVNGSEVHERVREQAQRLLTRIQSGA